MAASEILKARVAGYIALRKQQMQTRDPEWTALIAQLGK